MRIYIAVPRNGMGVMARIIVVIAGKERPSKELVAEGHNCVGEVGSC